MYSLLLGGNIMRVFIGIALPREVKEHLHQLTNLIKKSSYKGNFPTIDNYHITLKYIGQATSDDLDTLEDMIAFVAENTKPFKITIEDMGSFVKKGKHIVWVGLNHGKQSLKKLFYSLELLMEENGFTKEHRKYKPHITLGKQIVFSQGNGFVDVPAYNKEILVEKLTLFWSHREDDILVYSPIYEQMFQQPKEAKK